MNRIITVKLHLRMHNISATITGFDLLQLSSELPTGRVMIIIGRMPKPNGYFICSLNIS